MNKKQPMRCPLTGHGPVAEGEGALFRVCFPICQGEQD